MMLKLVPGLSRIVTVMRIWPSNVLCQKITIDGANFVNNTIHWVSFIRKIHNNTNFANPRSMVQVTVKEGVLEGEIIDNVFGGSYYGFKGIPFAEPPLGDLRFKAPRPVKPWTGVRSAKDHGPICYQYDSTIKSIPPNGSEDCLYLNVYSPEITPEKQLPVMVFIHGGAFSFGHGNSDQYGPEFIVREGVILVTFNYRVEALGFLCLDTPEIPGNAGTKDQVEALRWVKRNISSFGGDPENVTIFGASAGAASVSYHLISPMSKGLFKRAIAQSGAASCHWTAAIEPRERALALAKSLGCESQDDKKVYEFFRTQPKESLVRIKEYISLKEIARENKDLCFSIANEKQFDGVERFFHGDVKEAIRNNLHEGVKIMSGFCEDEGIWSLFGDFQREKVIAQLNKFPEMFVPRPLFDDLVLKDAFEVGRKVRKFYYNNETVTLNNLAPIVKYYSLIMFSFGVINFAKACAKKGNDVFLYKFMCKSDRNLFGHVMKLGRIMGKSEAVCHADELGYLFHSQLLNYNFEENSKSYQMIMNCVKLWTNFAKYGNPTPDDSLGAIWSPFSEDRQEYLEIDEQLSASAFPEKEELEFWEDIFRNYYPK